MHWYFEVLKKYVAFSGRAGRPEFWWFFLINLIVSIVLTVIDIQLGLLAASGIGIASTIYSLAVLLPSLGVAVRRLHDTDRSGWWMLIALIPLIGLIVLLVFFIMTGTPGDNRHGSNPAEA